MPDTALEILMCPVTPIGTTPYDTMQLAQAAAWMIGGKVRGGTGWAVELATQRKMDEIYVFDQVQCGWYRPIYIAVPPGKTTPGRTRVLWERTDVPKAHGRYAGIGTRNLTDDGRKAIQELYT